MIPSAGSDFGFDGRQAALARYGHPDSVSGEILSPDYTINMAGNAIGLLMKP